MNDFSELKYQLPSKESAHYIKIAVDIIRDLQKATPSALVYLLEASNILLFAGMRSASPYNDFADLSSDDISNLKLPCLLWRQYERFNALDLSVRTPPS